jgi:hypothetical protein
MIGYALFLRLLAEKVYTARLSTGQPVRDATDFNHWLTELADRAEANAREAVETFVGELG